jgi:pilus assembly protein Flp/PilA
MVLVAFSRKWIRMMEKCNQRAGAEVGATAIEYGLIAALVAVVIITGLTALGTALNTKFDSVASEVNTAAPGGGGEEPTWTPSPTATSTVTPGTGDETSPGSRPAQTATPTPGEEEPRILANTLCWLGPGPAYEVVSAVRAGSPVEVLGVGLGGGWLVVDNPHFPGVICWVPADAVELPDPVSLPSKIYSIPPTPTYTPEPERRQGCLVNSKCVVPCPASGQFPVCYK